ncbi:MAG: hypothetical protein IH914_02610 [candidate division Zixibacteria bacterium]|nr:hypothetical protein [candidate division Zixibacteria bacterium]
MGLFKVASITILVFVGHSLALSQFSDNDKSQLYPKVITVGRGVSCKWTPSGTALTYKVADTLIVYDVSTQERVSIGVIAGVHYEWLNDSIFVTLENSWAGGNGAGRDKSRSTIVRYYTYDTSSSAIVLDSSESFLASGIQPSRFVRSTSGSIGIVDYARIAMTFETQHSMRSRRTGQDLYIRALISPGQALNTPRNLSLVDAAGDEVQRIATGAPYYFPKLSPDGSMVSCHSNGQLVLLSVSGDIIATIPRSTGESWSPCGQKLFYNKPIEDGYDIIGSELYSFDISALEETQLTNTPDKIELSPLSSPNGDMLAYYSYNHGVNVIEILVLVRQD